ncbi:hypothetical protein GWK47_001683 [Chionoecetes opilio]|uniref:Uncharacterized protein n=1 Tax=Chionoecetes opilio TaxID=41210 RepID=A0A8J4XU97_CHIOP|nr:hypothetical protein GWK47_001683 [Chionoecetes opilio]
MAMGGVDQELVRKETMRMKKLARKSEMAGRRRRWQRLSSSRRWTFPTLRHRHLDPSSQENSPFRGETSSQVSSPPKKRLKVPTGSGLCAGQDEPLRPEGDPLLQAVASSSGLTPVSPKHTSSNPE